MRIKLSVLAAIACVGWILVGCNARESAAPEARETPSPPPSVEPASLTPFDIGTTPDEATPTTIPKAPPSATAVPHSAPTESAQSARKPSPSSPSQPSEAAAEPVREAATPLPVPPAPAPIAPAQAPSASTVEDPGGPIAVAPTRAGLTRVGAEKCKLCHKIQFASWVETAHARRTPPLECESCHGPGSEYKSLTIMKDPEKAKAAGLVIPTAAFCKTCHARGWKDDMLRKAHAHKTPPGS
jgi:hypothetical protein